MPYLVIQTDSNVTPESCLMTTSCDNPRLVIHGSYIPLSTNSGGGGVNFSDGVNSYRAMEYKTTSSLESASATYLTTANSPDGLSSITNLTRVSTSATIYQTRASTSGYGTRASTSATLTRASTSGYSGCSISISSGGREYWSMWVTRWHSANYGKSNGIMSADIAQKTTYPQAVAYANVSFYSGYNMFMQTRNSDLGQYKGGGNYSYSRIWWTYYTSTDGWPQNMTFYAANQNYYTCVNPSFGKSPSYTTAVNSQTIASTAIYATQYTKSIIYYTATGSAGMSSTTALTRTSTSGYATRASTSATYTRASTSATRYETRASVSGYSGISSSSSSQSASTTTWA